MEGCLVGRDGGRVARTGSGIGRLLCLGLLPGLFAFQSAEAQELALGAGRLHEVGKREFTYTWRMDYFQTLSRHMSLSFGWLNEGHLPGHHRDGWISQLWTIHEVVPGHLRLGLGLGVYRAYDTRLLEGGYRNEHNTRPLLTLGMAHYLGDGPWSAQIQMNRTLGSRDPVSQSVILGMALHLGASLPTEHHPSTPGAEGRNELLFFYGQTILNSDLSETSDAYQLGYRRTLSPHWAWSLSYINEGAPERLRRDGLNAQLWVEGRFLERRLRLGFGFGPYATRVEHFDGGPDRDDVRLSSRVSLAAGWRLAPRWNAHFFWNRTATSYHRDTDMLAAGLGFDW